ncbi:MAG: hypothetical protein JWO10_943, partial [Microbacteriaceae bacterium]|nr:hypothetical protein [Microbacteriaceae bacterium]
EEPERGCRHDLEPVLTHIQRNSKVVRRSCDREHQRADAGREVTAADLLEAQQVGLVCRDKARQFASGARLPQVVADQGDCRGHALHGSPRNCEFRPRYGSSRLQASTERRYPDGMPTAPVVNPFLHLQKNADDNPRGVFSQSAEQVMTNAEAVVYVKQLAFEMRRLGVKAGDIVALDLPDQLSILFTEAVYHEAGISTVLPDGYVADGVFQVDWLFTRGTPAVQRGAEVISVDERFLRQVQENPYGISPSEAPIDTLRIVFSSGTTGSANAMALGREMEQLMDLVLPAWFQGGPHVVMMDTGTAWGIGEFFLSVKGGQPYLCVGGAAPDVVVRVVAQYSAKSLRGSAQQVAAVVDELERQNRTLPSIQSVFVGGTAMPPVLAARMRVVAEGCVVASNYGSTEAGGIAVRPYDSEDPSDAGHLLPGSQAQIVDEDDQPLPNGRAGRVRLKSVGMIHEYLGNPDGTKLAFKDGWFYPGDLGLIRADGGLTITGRESELLNAGGVKIDPTRLDHFALQNPQVTDAASFGYEAKSGLTQIGMVLVTEAGIDIKALVADLTAEFGSAAPKLVARVDTIPRTATGKPLRRTLSEQYKES